MKAKSSSSWMPPGAVTSFSSARELTPKAQKGWPLHRLIVTFQSQRAHADSRFREDWALVKAFKLSYHDKEALLFTIGPYIVVT